MSATCTSCERPIRWVKIARSGRSMPLNPIPDPAGNIKLLATADERGNQLAAFITGDDVVSADRRYVSHFATCPNAAVHRNAS